MHSVKSSHLKYVGIQDVYTLVGYKMCIRFVVSESVLISYCASAYISLSICPSVRYVPVLYENGLTYFHSVFTVRLPNHSSFTSIKHLTQNSDGVIVPFPVTLNEPNPVFKVTPLFDAKYLKRLQIRVHSYYIEDE